MIPKAASRTRLKSIPHHSITPSKFATNMDLLAEHARSPTTNPTIPPRPPRRTPHPPKRAMPNRGNPKGRQTRCNLHSNLNGRP